MSETGKHISELENQLSLHGVYATNTSGVSMRPLFKTHRDVVVIEKPEGELKKYDVVLYKALNEEKFILHRIIGVREDVYVIRGDNTFIKEYVKKDRIIGVLTSFNRKGKRHTVDEAGYRLYSRFWNFIYPIRWFFKKVRSVLGRIYRKLFRKKR